VRRGYRRLCTPAGGSRILVTCCTVTYPGRGATAAVRDGGDHRSWICRPARADSDPGQCAYVSQITSAALTWSVIILVPLILLIVATATPGAIALNPANASEHCNRADMINATSHMLVVFAPQILFYGISVVLYGLQAYRRFAGPTLGPAISSLVVIGRAGPAAWRSAAGSRSSPSTWPRWSPSRSCWPPAGSAAGPPSGHRSRHAGRAGRRQARLGQRGGGRGRCRGRRLRRGGLSPGPGRPEDGRGPAAAAGPAPGLDGPAPPALGRRQRSVAHAVPGRAAAFAGQRGR